MRLKRAVMRPMSRRLLAMFVAAVVALVTIPAFAAPHHAAKGKTVKTTKTVKTVKTTKKKTVHPAKAKHHPTAKWKKASAHPGHAHAKKPAHHPRKK